MSTTGAASGSPLASAGGAGAVAGVVAGGAAGAGVVVGTAARRVLTGVVAAARTRGDPDDGWTAIATAPTVRTAAIHQTSVRDTAHQNRTIRRVQANGGDRLGGVYQWFLGKRHRLGVRRLPARRGAVAGAERAVEHAPVAAVSFGGIPSHGVPSHCREGAGAVPPRWNRHRRRPLVRAR